VLPVELGGKGYNKEWKCCAARWCCRVLYRLIDGRCWQMEEERRAALNGPLNNNHRFLYTWNMRRLTLNMSSMTSCLVTESWRRHSINGGQPFVKSIISSFLTFRVSRVRDTLRPSSAQKLLIALQLETIKSFETVKFPDRDSSGFLWALSWFSRPTDGSTIYFYGKV
jgi:hypothetical protein